MLQITTATGKFLKCLRQRAEEIVVLLVSFRHCVYKRAFDQECGKKLR